MKYKEVYIDRTLRMIQKNTQGFYVVYLDDADVRWLNKIAKNRIKKESV